MARKPKFEARKTPHGWQVNVPAGVSSTGKRERCYFESRDKARDFATKLREAVAEHGSQSGTIRPALAEEAVKAQEVLKPWGKSLLEAAHFLADTLKRQGRPPSSRLASGRTVGQQGGTRAQVAGRCPPMAAKCAASYSCIGLRRGRLRP